MDIHNYIGIIIFIIHYFTIQYHVTIIFLLYIISQGLKKFEVEKKNESIRKTKGLSRKREEKLNILNISGKKEEKRKLKSA